MRRVAAALETQIDARVEAVSLLHSSAVDPKELDGLPARLLEPALQTFFQASPAAEAVVVPFFFGPSGALTDYLPARMESLTAKFSRARIRTARWLVDVENDKDIRIASALADAARATVNSQGIEAPKFVLTDHGSPQPAVTAVRASLARQVTSLLGVAAKNFGVAAMERRPEPEYAFNDPLLAARLRTPPFDEGNVVVLLQFLSPGRHAGEAGDIAAICAEAERLKPRLKTWRTEPIGTDRRVISVLAERYRAAIE